MSMSEVLKDINNASSWSEASILLGKLLGLEEAVPLPVVRRALRDDFFSQNLLMCRNNPKLLEMLFNDPQNAAYEIKENKKRSNNELLFKATGALVKWSKSGFSKVNEAEFKRRYDICKRCDELVEPSNQMAYKIVYRNAKDRRVCNNCGCVASGKAWITTENCSKPHPQDPELSLWREPLTR
ncbi:MAG: hypothetical protein HQL54_01575 [Magnetococcales bacterium]|nr:hypothetical protein [Magnetococcales bacterium]